MSSWDYGSGYSAEQIADAYSTDFTGTTLSSDQIAALIDVKPAVNIPLGKNGETDPNMSALPTDTITSKSETEQARDTAAVARIAATDRSLPGNSSFSVRSLLGDIAKGGNMAKVAISIAGLFGMAINPVVALTAMTGIGLAYGIAKNSDGLAAAGIGKGEQSSIAVSSGTGTGQGAGAGVVQPTVTVPDAMEIGSSEVPFDYQAIATGKAEADQPAEQPVPLAPTAEPPSRQELFDQQLFAFYDRLRGNVRSFPFMAKG